MDVAVVLLLLLLLVMLVLVLVFLFILVLVLVLATFGCCICSCCVVVVFFFFFCGDKKDKSRIFDYCYVALYCIVKQKHVLLLAVPSKYQIRWQTLTAAAFEF